MQLIVIREVGPEDAEAIRAFLVRSFGDEVVVAHGKRTEPARLATLVALAGGRPLGEEHG